MAKGQAKKGGEIGVNGERYKGGQFMPSSKHTRKGEININFPDLKTKGRQVVEPGVTEPKPIGYVSLYSGMREFVQPVDGDTKTLERNHHGDDVIKNFGFTAKTLKERIEKYNAGERWMKQG